MGTKKHMSAIVIAVLGVASLLMSGCLDADTPAAGSGDVRVKSSNPDPRIAFLVDDMGVNEDLIKVETEGLDGDTGYAIYPTVSPAAKSKGVLGSGVGFTARSIDKMIQEAARREAQAAKFEGRSLPAQASDKARENSPFKKKAHTRWDYWNSLMDVKALTEVRQIRVYIYKAGSMQVGPMWTQATRNAIANWNAQAKGSAISFVETADSNASDMKIRGVFGLGPDGSYTHAAYLTPDPYVENGGLYLLVNIGYEHNGVPMNQKTTCVMSLLAMGLNLGFVGMEGMFWNMGDLVHIPGTPWWDGDSWTPGSSILTYGSTSYSTPALSAGDLTMVRTVYPIDGVMATDAATRAMALTYEALTGNGGFAGTKRLQVVGDTTYSVSQAGHLARRIGTGNYELLWTNGNYGSNAVDEAIYSKGYLAVRTFGGSIYTKVGNANWVLQIPGGVAANSMRLDASRLTYALGPNRDLYDLYITPTGASWHALIWYGSPGMTDFRTRNGLLVIAQDGAVWGMQNYEGWYYLLDPNTIGRTAKRLYLSDNMVVAYTEQPGSHGHFSVMPYGFYAGIWHHFPYNVYNPNDVDVCGQKLAFLHESAYLSIIDFEEWSMYDHYLLSNPLFKQIRLTGENCHYVSARDASGGLYGKFGVDLNTDYFKYYDNSNLMPTKW